MIVCDVHGVCVCVCVCMYVFCICWCFDGFRYSLRKDPARDNGLWFLDDGLMYSLGVLF